MPTIKEVHAREILDSRGNPTVEVYCALSDGTEAKAAVPSGASTGTQEAFELRDNDPKRYHGKGVNLAIRNVNEEIAPKLIGKSPFEQSNIDKFLIELDGTENKRRLGANAILGVSMAVARAAAKNMGTPLFFYIAEQARLNHDPKTLPLPMFNIMNGGVHADSSLDFQEFMIAPIGAPSMKEALRMASETYHTLKSVLHDKGYSVAIGDEGGFAPKLKANTEAIELILRAIEKAGYRPGEDIVIALDPAASEFYEDGYYVFKKSDGRKLSSEEMISYWENWLRVYPILSLEDGLAEGDERGWKSMTERLGARVQLVGDDNFVTNPKIIKRAIEEKIANAALIKLNQIGTVTETLQAISISHSAGYGTVISHRSGETWDDFMSDLAVGAGSLQLKSGAPVRGERVAKYNRLVRIEEEIGDSAIFAKRTPFAQERSES
jgi:enolase